MHEQVITFATPVFILLILIEMLIGWRRKRSHFFFSDTINSIGLGVMSQVTSAFLTLLLIGIYAWVANNFALLRLPNTWWIWIIALLLYDLLYYWYHRCSHVIAILWAAHVVHHQSERYNLTTALRQTSTGPLLSWIFYLPMAFLGFPVSMFITVGLIDLLYQFWVHTEVIHKLGWFDRVFVSPSNHRVHHATNSIYLDKNYGGIFILWDRFFNTFIEEMDEHKVVYGTRSPLRSWNPIKANVEVYQALLNDVQRTSAWSDKLRLWFKHPGWLPADIAQQSPHAPFDLQRPNFEPLMPTSWKWYTGVQFVLILLVTTHFLATHHATSTAQGVLYGCWLTAGLVTIGGLTEKNNKYLVFEAIRLVLTLIFVVATGSWFDGQSISIEIQTIIVALGLVSMAGLGLMYKHSD